MVKYNAVIWFCEIKFFMLVEYANTSVSITVILPVLLLPAGPMSAAAGSRNFRFLARSESKRTARLTIIGGKKLLCMYPLYLLYPFLSANKSKYHFI